MSLRDTIQEEIKTALRGGDQLRLSSLRLLFSEIKNEEIKKKEILGDDEIVAIVQRQIKQRREAAEVYRQGGRDDLAQKEETEVKILSSFLPQQLSEEEIKKVVEEVISGLPAEDKNNFGKIMGPVMARVKGQTDGNTVSKVVKELTS